MKKASFVCLCLLILFATMGGEITWADTESAEDGALEYLSITLEQVIDLALKANRGIVFSANTVKSQEFSVNAAESEFEIKFAPAVDAAASGSEDTTDTEKDVRVEGAVEKKFELGPQGAIVPRVSRSDIGEYTSGIGVRLNIPLLQGFGREVNLDSVNTASFNLKESRYSYSLTRDRTVVDSVTAVYAIIEQEKLLELYQGQIERYRSHADVARVKEKAGLASQIDVARANLNVQEAEANINRTLKSLSDAKDRLKILLTIPLDIDLQVAAPLGYESLQLQMEQALEIALANRIELKQARGRVDEAQRKTRVSKKNLLPDLNVLMRYERVGTADDLRESIELDQNNWSVALLGDQSWPRTAEKAAVQQSLITVKTARLNLSLTRDEIEREVRDQLETLIRIENDIAIRQEQIRTSEGKLALAEIKFRYDMANNFDVIESENELERAKIDLLTARTEYIVGIYRMRSVLGTLIQ